MQKKKVGGAQIKTKSNNNYPCMLIFMMIVFMVIAETVELFNCFGSHMLLLVSNNARKKFGS